MDIKQDILEYLIGIPKGKVMTYKTLADVFGVHPRKVAMTMKYNDSP
jgi:alkylated DNA nucleotide flippase Atl1